MAGELLLLPPVLMPGVQTRCAVPGCLPKIEATGAIRILVVGVLAETADGLTGAGIPKVEMGGAMFLMEINIRQEEHRRQTRVEGRIHLVEVGQWTFPELSSDLLPHRTVALK
ncbi:hypothetical protein FRC07_006805 [Ceratobasidium sp. 392]|nr:hypothetical protein FRC07_006805 [Ceratobasidium sp. 392]